VSPLPVDTPLVEEHRPVLRMTPEEAEAVASWLAQAWAAMPDEQREDLALRMRRVAERVGRDRAR